MGGCITENVIVISFHLPSFSHHQGKGSQTKAPIQLQVFLILLFLFPRAGVS